MFISLGLVVLVVVIVLVIVLLRRRQLLKEAVFMQSASGITAVVAFVIALLLNLFDVSKGHLNYVTAALIGLLALTIYLVAGPWSGWTNRGTRTTARNPQ
jgi:cytochrome c biogenesis factor